MISKTKPKSKPGRPPAPTHLSKPAQALWARINDDFVLDNAGLAVLTAGLQAFDRSEQARELIEKQGVTFIDRFKQIRPNPACTVERDNRAAFLAALRQLNLDLVGPGGK